MIIYFTAKHIIGQKAICLKGQICNIKGFRVDCSPELDSQIFCYIDVLINGQK